MQVAVTVQVAGTAARALPSNTTHLDGVSIDPPRFDWFSHRIFPHTIFHVIHPQLLLVGRNIRPIPPVAPTYLQISPRETRERHSPKVEKRKVEILHGSIRINHSHRWLPLNDRRQVQCSIPDIIWWALRNNACEGVSVDATTDGHEAVEEHVGVYPDWGGGDDRGRVGVVFELCGISLRMKAGREEDCVHGRSGVARRVSGLGWWEMRL